MSYAFPLPGYLIPHTEADPDETNRFFAELINLLEKETSCLKKIRVFIHQKRKPSWEIISKDGLMKKGHYGPHGTRRGVGKDVKKLNESLLAHSSTWG